MIMKLESLGTVLSRENMKKVKGGTGKADGCLPYGAGCGSCVEGPLYCCPDVPCLGSSFTRVGNCGIDTSGGPEES